MREIIKGPSFFIGRGQGDGLISFGSGQPDLPPPPEVFETLATYRDFKYGLIQGSAELREALAQQYPNAHRDQFVITNGASEALDLVLRALHKPEGYVLLPRPYYYSYPHNVWLAHMQVRYYDLDKGKIDLKNFEENLMGCTAVIINSPSNPTGTIQDIPTLKAIEKLCAEKGVWVISDEVYKDLMYERENYLIEGEKVITINSFSKTFSMCGHRVGYLYARDPKMVADVIEMKTHTSMNTSIVGQEMAFAATKVPREHVEEQLKIWTERRDVFYKGMLDLGLDVWKPEGAFYLFPKFPKPATDVVHDLYYDHQIITYSGEWFGNPNRVRFSYALDKEKIEEGLERLKKYLGSLS